MVDKPSPLDAVLGAGFNTARCLVGAVSTRGFWPRNSSSDKPLAVTRFPPRAWRSGPAGIMNGTRVFSFSALRSG